MRRRMGNDLAAIDASIKKWQTRLTRAVNAINKLSAQRKRVVAKRPPEKAVASLPTLGEVIERIEPTIAKDDPIPAFLKRGLAAQNAVDAATAEAIKTEKAEHDKAKAKGRIAKMKAKRSGELRKMPLTGKAALNYINQR